MQGRVAELFAGVGGFRLGLEGHAGFGVPGSGWAVIWSNQWEPATRRQHASDCYVARFGKDHHWNDDVARVLDRVDSGDVQLPSLDLLVGGFPCQDYSVARVLNQAAGIRGKKGVLWWEIHRMLLLANPRPRFLFLENVDRLLKSPASQRGRDFAVMLHCLNKLGYTVEWRVVNAADYGFPQRRRRVFIVAELTDDLASRPTDWILRDGVLATALPVTVPGSNELLPLPQPADFTLPREIIDLSDTFSADFGNAGVAMHRKIWTARLETHYEGPRRVLADVLQPHDEVPDQFFIPRERVKEWRYLKGAKREARVVARNGFKYFYSEGAVPFPDPVDRPARTILTGEGGVGPSRFKHVVSAGRNRFRRLTPLELERLNGFPDGWTDTGMGDGRRAFMMGNALVVGVVRLIGSELARRANLDTEQQVARVAG